MFKHNGRIVFGLGVLLVLIGAASLQFSKTALARESVNPSTSKSITIPYSGKLSGSQVRLDEHEEYWLHFALFDNEQGGDPLWSETHGSISLEAGRFQVNLGSIVSLPADLQPGAAFWLEVAVKRAGEDSYTILSPRQRLLSSSSTRDAFNTPTLNGPTCPHDHFGEQWSGSYGGDGLRISNDSYLGIGLSAEGGEIGVEGVSNNGIAVKGDSSIGVGVEAVSFNGDALTASSTNGASIKALGTGTIFSAANSVMVLSPFTMVSRGNTNVTLTAMDTGAMLIISTAGTEDKYFAIPVSSFGTLFGSQLYIKSLEVCYKTDLNAFIEVTGIYKNDGAESHVNYLEDFTHRDSGIRACYTINSTKPYKAIDNSTWVQFNIDSNGHSSWFVFIYSTKLTLYESAY
jgi:hypothetical protein